MEAIVLNKAVVYYFLSQALMLGDSIYKETEQKAGKATANQLLSETLLVFRRQIKHKKLALRISASKVLVNKDNLDLFDYLANLFSLIRETGPVNPYYNKNHEFEQQLVKGPAFRKVYEVKDSILNALHSFGCKEQEDKEEIFDESLLVFWKKLCEGEVGIFFSTNNQKPENCRVFNKLFYQNSKLSTYLSGIAKNIFLNKTRTSEYQISRSNQVEISDSVVLNPVQAQADTPALFLFLYYRNMVEDRKLRTIISLLQYDCNLEDREVRQLIGINNSRIHSSRLRAHFSEWYYNNINRVPELVDAAHDYLLQREEKKEMLNKKIRAVDSYIRHSLNYLDLNIFKEEFRAIDEFKKHFRIFKYIFYFASAGKPSSLSGLPDEKTLRSLMEIYKEVLFDLPRHNAILNLLFYGTDEPNDLIISLLNSLSLELESQDSDSVSGAELTKQLKENLPANVTTLKEAIYNTNKTLFNRFSADTNFTQLIYENETLQRAF